jgi:hypothetical protein
MLAFEREDTKVQFTYENIKIWEIPLRCSELLDGNIVILKQDLNISEPEFDKICERLMSYLLTLKENFCAKILIRRINLRTFEVHPLSRYNKELQRRFTSKLYEIGTRRQPLDEEGLVNTFVMIDEFRQNQNNYGTKLGLSILRDYFIVPGQLRKIYREELSKIFKEFSTLYWLDMATRNLASDTYKELLSQEVNCNNVDTVVTDPLREIYMARDGKLETIVSQETFDCAGSENFDILASKFTERSQFGYFRDLKSNTLWFQLGETSCMKKASALMAELLKRSLEDDKTLPECNDARPLCKKDLSFSASSFKNVDGNFSNLIKNYCKGHIVSG